MKVKLTFNIVDILKDDEIEITINAKQKTDELQKIINNIEVMSNEINTIIGTKDNEAYVISINNVIRFYSEEQKCFCETAENTFYIKRRLYELEEKLDKNSFIRISNSCIVNVQHIKSFDLNTTGNIVIKLQNGKFEYVSKRRISNIMKFLRERW